MVFRNNACEAEVKDVSTTIKARFPGGVLEPLEELELTEGQEVTVTILSVPSTRDADFLTRTADGWAGLIDAEKLKQEVNESPSRRATVNEI
jgi:predicted DNA-binding antitoxin AbrB/MazE fold protein